MKLLFKQKMFSWFDSYDIYDESGKLVEECESKLRTFQNVNQKFTKLTKGKYTVITVATYVNNNKIWDFENKEKPLNLKY